MKHKRTHWSRLSKDGDTLPGGGAGTSLPGKKSDDPPKPEVYSKEDVDKMVKDAIEANKAEFKKHIADLNEENKKHRLGKNEVIAVLAESLGLDKKEVTESEILMAKITEIVTAQKALQTQFEESEKEKTKLKKEMQVKELITELGLDPKLTLKLVNLDAQDLKAELSTLMTEFPQIVIRKDVGGGSNPAGGGSKVELETEYKALIVKDKLTGAEQRRLNELVMSLEGKDDSFFKSIFRKDK